MDFLREQFIVSLVDQDSLHTTFVAELFDVRPAFGEIAIFDNQQEAKRICEKMQKVMAKDSCPIAWATILIDARGCCLLAASKQPVQTCNMRMTLQTVLKALPAAQVKAIRKSMRGLDELDVERIRAFALADEMREDFVQFQDSDDEEEIPQTVAIRRPDAIVLRGTLHDEWAFKASAVATIKLLEVGSRPVLEYMRCHREERRHLLLVSRVGATTCTGAPLAHTATIIAQLASEGVLPTITQKGLKEHGRKRDFLLRCARVATEVYPGCETDVKKLDAQSQNRVRAALGDEARYDGCLTPECLDKPPLWEPLNENSELTRCQRCKEPRGLKRMREVQEYQDRAQWDIIKRDMIESGKRRKYQQVGPAPEADEPKS